MYPYLFTIYLIIAHKSSPYKYTKNKYSYKQNDPKNT